MLKRTAPMPRGTGFKRTAPPPRPVRQCEYRPRPREIASACAAPVMGTPSPKEDALQHEGYMALVRKLPCARCGIYRPGLIQFCHADEGKGMGIKTDCRRGWPGCGPHDGDPGCHWYVGTSGRMTRQERRAFEAQAGAEARTAILDSGLWPKSLPLWRETEDMT